MANGMTSGLMLSSGCMEQPTNFPQQSRNVSEGQIVVLWDMENCPVPSDVRPEDVAGNIRMALRVHPVIKGTVSMISAYGDFNGFPRRLREGCQQTGVNLIDVPNGRKDAADKAILVDMFLFALDNPPPAIIMLISGDVDFSRALHVLGQRGYTVILVIPSGVGVSSALSNAGSYVWDWSSVVRGVGFVPPVPPARARPMVQPDAGANEEAIVYRGTSMESRSSSEQNSNDVMWVQPGDLNGLKGQFVKLLESSGGQIPIGRLPSDYQKSFGRPLYVSEYGTLKLVNLLKKMSDVICVEGQGQKKLVLLKKCSTQTIIKHDRKGKAVQEENTVVVARGSSDEFSEDEIIVFEQRDERSTEILNQFRYELQEILVCYSCRIFLGCFEAIYQQRYKRPLDCRKFGVNKLEELFEKVKEVVELHEEPASRKKFLVAVGL